MGEKAERHDRAVSDLGIRNRIRLAGLDLQLVSLVRRDDLRPLSAPWLSDKQVSLLAVDVDGNFVLRHSGGYIVHRNHSTSVVTRLASSIDDFVRSIELE